MDKEKNRDREKGEKERTIHATCWGILRHLHDDFDQIFSLLFCN